MGKALSWICGCGVRVEAIRGEHVAAWGVGRGAAIRFGISVATAIRWAQLQRDQGSTAPKCKAATCIAAPSSATRRYRRTPISPIGHTPVRVSSGAASGQAIANNNQISTVK